MTADTKLLPAIAVEDGVVVSHTVKGGSAPGVKRSLKVLKEDKDKKDADKQTGQDPAKIA